MNRQITNNIKTKSIFLISLLIVNFITNANVITHNNSSETGSTTNANSAIVADSAIALFLLINQRLQYMPDVALYKAQHALPIENLEREKSVLKNTVKTAKQQGLQTNQVSRFFQAQMNVAKAIQYRYRAELLSDPIEKLAPDLNQTVRPALIKLGDEIINQIANHIQTHGKFSPSLAPLFESLVNHQYISKRDKQLLFQGLLAIR